MGSWVMLQGHESTLHWCPVNMDMPQVHKVGEFLADAKITVSDIFTHLEGSVSG